MQSELERWIERIVTVFLKDSDQAMSRLHKFAEEQGLSPEELGELETFLKSRLEQLKESTVGDEFTKKLDSGAKKLQLVRDKLVELLTHRETDV